MHGDLRMASGFGFFTGARARFARSREWLTLALPFAFWRRRLSGRAFERAELSLRIGKDQRAPEKRIPSARSTL
jgi:hypothetical protein